MRYLNIFAPLALSVMLAGCATGYQSVSNPLVGWTGGYWEKNGPGELVQVGFAGNSLITEQKVGVYLLYRCAEIAKEAKKPYFAFYASLPEAVADRRSSERFVNSTIGKPTTFAYILFFDKPEPDLLETAEVLARLKPEVNSLQQAPVK